MQPNKQVVRRDNNAGVDSPRWVDAPYYPDATGQGIASEPPRISALLRRYRLQIGCIFGFFLLAGLIWMKVSPVSYRSKILLEVLAQNQDFLNNKALDPNTSMPSPDTYVETQTKLLTTDEVIDRTAKILGPTVPQEIVNREGLIDRVRGLFGQTPDPSSRTGDAIVRDMITNAKVKSEGQATLISVTIDGPDAKLTANTANTLADQFIEQVQEARWNAAARTGEFLSGQLENMRKKLQDSEDKLQAYARSVGLIYTDASRESVAAERLREIQVDLARAEADLDDKLSQLELVKNSPADALPKVSDDNSFRDYKSRLAELRRQKADLEASYTPEHYKVKHVKSQIDELQAEMERERNTIVHRIQNDYSAARRREQLLADTYHKQLATVSDQSLAQVHYNMLQREVEASRQVYQSMLQRVKEAGVVSALRASNIRVASAARVPLHRYSPSLPKVMGVAVLSAIMISVLFVLLRERANRSIRNPGESIKLISVPELGVIPTTKVISGAGAASLKRKVLEISGGSDRPETLPVAITSWNGNESLVKESIRSVVTSLVMYGESFYRNRIILMTSPHPQAGKTTAVSNLGLALAESGRKVLIIDGDLRRPRLSGIFGVQDDRGLADLLAASREKVSLDSVIQKTAYPNLSILPSGEAALELPKLLHSPRLEEILASVRHQYDFILLDSPPMMALTDARLLSRNTDGVILVCRAGRTTGEQLAFSHRRLAEDGIEVIGTILNDWNPRSEDPSYFSSYSDYARSTRG
jgi:capsular exopolysaccharide synthesis family protein